MAVTCTRMGVPWLNVCVWSLKALQKFMRLSPRCPIADPTGGWGVAFPAGKIIRNLWAMARPGAAKDSRVLLSSLPRVSNPESFKMAAGGVINSLAAAVLSLAIARPLHASPVKVIYDANCPVCITNKSILTALDRKRGFLQFVDLASPEFGKIQNVNREDAMRHIHVIKPDGEIVKGVDGVLLAFEVVGLRWIVGVLRYPLFRWAVATFYSVISRHRHAISNFVPFGKQMIASANTVHQMQQVSDGLGCDDEEECELVYDDEDE